MRQRTSEGICHCVPPCRKSREHKGTPRTPEQEPFSPHQAAGEVPDPPTHSSQYTRWGGAQKIQFKKGVQSTREASGVENKENIKIRAWEAYKLVGEKDACGSQETTVKALSVFTWPQETDYRWEIRRLLWSGEDHHCWKATEHQFGKGWPRRQTWKGRGRELKKRGGKKDSLSFVDTSTQTLYLTLWKTVLPNGKPIDIEARFNLTLKTLILPFTLS